MDRLRKYITIGAIVLANLFSKGYAQEKFTISDEDKKVVRTLAEHVIENHKAKETKGDTIHYKIYNIPMLDNDRFKIDLLGKKQLYNVSLYLEDNNGNGKIDSLDELSIKLSLTKKDPYHYLTEDFVDKGADGLITEFKDWYLVYHLWKENGEKARAEGWYEPSTLNNKELKKLNKKYISTIKKIIKKSKNQNTVAVKDTIFHVDNLVIDVHKVYKKKDRLFVAITDADGLETTQKWGYEIWNGKKIRIKWLEYKAKNRLILVDKNLDGKLDEVIFDKMWPGPYPLWRSVFDDDKRIKLELRHQKALDCIYKKDYKNLKKYITESFY